MAGAWKSEESEVAITKLSESGRTNGHAISCCMRSFLARVNYMLQTSGSLPLWSASASANAIEFSLIRFLKFIWGVTAEGGGHCWVSARRAIEPGKLRFPNIRGYWLMASRSGNKAHRDNPRIVQRRALKYQQLSNRPLRRWPSWCAHHFNVRILKFGFGRRMCSCRNVHGRWMHSPGSYVRFQWNLLVSDRKLIKYFRAIDKIGRPLSLFLAARFALVTCCPVAQRPAACVRSSVCHCNS